MSDRRRPIINALVVVTAVTVALISIAVPAPADAASRPEWHSQFVAVPGGGVSALAGDTSAVFALSWPLSSGPTSTNPIGTITRIGLSRLGAHSSTTVPGAEDVALVGRSLWVVAVTFPHSGSGTARIERYVASTMKFIGSSVVADAVPRDDMVSMTAVPGGTPWMSAGSHLYRLASASGRVLQMTSLSIDIDSVSESADGRLLYASGVRLHIDEYAPPLGVVELNAATGQVLASVASGAVAGGTVSAFPDGVWVSARSGMAGGSSLFGQEALMPVPSPTPPPPSPATSNSPLGQATGMGADSPFESIGGVVGVVSNHVLWLSAFAYLACADPTTQAVRGYELASTPFESGAVVSVGQLVVVGREHGVTIVRPPRSCFG